LFHTLMTTLWFLYRSYRPDFRRDAELWYHISVKPILLPVRKLLLILLVTNLHCIVLQLDVVSLFSYSDLVSIFSVFVFSISLLSGSLLHCFLVLLKQYPVSLPSLRQKLSDLVKV